MDENYDEQKTILNRDIMHMKKKNIEQNQKQWLFLFTWGTDFFSILLIFFNKSKMKPLLNLKGKYPICDLSVKTVWLVCGSLILLMLFVVVLIRWRIEAHSACILYRCGVYFVYAVR